MVVTQKRSTRKHTGGRYIGKLTKRLSHVGSNASLTGIGSKRKKTTRTRGGSKKSSLLSIEEVNIYDPKTKKHSKAKLKSVVESNSNRNYVRRNIITKGSVVETDKGAAIVTNRPGQEGAVNVVLSK